MATNDQVTVDIPQQMDELHELENELVTSPQEHNEFNVNVSVEEETVQQPQNSTSFSKEIKRRNRHIKLYRAALKGDWNTAERIYKKDNIDIPVKLSKDGNTALHIAAAARKTDFVKKLLEKMNEGDLVIKNNAGNTAFFLAAASKRVEIAKAMRKKNKDIVKIRGDNDMLPLHKAALRGDKQMVEYLYEVTEDELLDNDDRIKLLVNLINHGLYDVALDLVERHPQIALIRDNNEETALHLLARIPVLTRSYNSHPMRVHMKLAIYLYNEVKRDVIKRCHSVFGRQRVKKRNELSLRDRMNEREQQRRKMLGWVGRIKEARDEAMYEEGNNILHLVAKLPPVDRPDIESPALHYKMASDMRWFKRVKKILHPVVAEAKNKEGKTARAIFT